MDDVAVTSPPKPGLCAALVLIVRRIVIPSCWSWMSAGVMGLEGKIREVIHELGLNPAADCNEDDPSTAVLFETVISWLDTIEADKHDTTKLPSDVSYALGLRDELRKRKAMADTVADEIAKQQAEVNKAVDATLARVKEKSASMGEDRQQAAVQESKEKLFKWATAKLEPKKDQHLQLSAAVFALNQRLDDLILRPAREVMAELNQGPGNSQVSEEQAMQSECEAFLVSHKPAPESNEALAPDGSAKKLVQSMPAEPQDSLKKPVQSTPAEPQDSTKKPVQSAPAEPQDSEKKPVQSAPAEPQDSTKKPVQSAPAEPQDSTKKPVQSAPAEPQDSAKKPVQFELAERQDSAKKLVQFVPGGGFQASGAPNFSG